MHTTLFWGQVVGGLPYFGIYFGDGPIKVLIAKLIKELKLWDAQ
jgi:hypothetical protein